MRRLSDLCASGESTREAAIREALAKKGLSDEEIEAQLDLDRAILSESQKNVAKLLALGGEGPSTNAASPDSTDFINNLIAEAESLRRQTGYALDTIFDPIKPTFAFDIASFVPAIFAEINRLISLGYDIDELPFQQLIGAKYSEVTSTSGELQELYDYVSSWFSTSTIGNHFLRLYSPRFNF